MRCFQGDRKMKHGKKCKIDKYTLILIVLLLLLTGLVIAWKLPQKKTGIYMSELQYMTVAIHLWKVISENWKIR